MYCSGVVSAMRRSMQIFGVAILLVVFPWWLWSDHETVAPQGAGAAPRLSRASALTSQPLPPAMKTDRHDAAGVSAPIHHQVPDYSSTLTVTDAKLADRRELVPQATSTQSPAPTRQSRKAGAQSERAVEGTAPPSLIDALAEAVGSSRTAPPHSAAPPPPEMLNDPYDLYFAALTRFEQQEMDATSARALRDHLLKSADEHATDPLSPELIKLAADISASLGEDDMQRALLREFIEHPLVEETSRIYGLNDLAVAVWSGGGDNLDLAQVFYLKNEVADAIENISDPAQRAGFMNMFYSVTLDKAALLMYCYKNALNIPDSELPERDRGKGASDYYRELLTQIDEMSRYFPALKPLDLRIDIAVSLAYEGKADEALALFDRLVDDPEMQSDPTLPRASILALSLATALDPTVRRPNGGEHWVAYLEDFLPLMPTDADRSALGQTIARWYLTRKQLGQPYIDYVEPLVSLNGPCGTSEDGHPAKGETLRDLAHAYECPDVDDPARAIEYYRLYLDLATDVSDVDREMAWESLAELYARPEIGDYKRAIQYYQRIIQTTADESTAQSAAKSIRALRSLMSSLGGVGDYDRR